MATVHFQIIDQTHEWVYGSQGGRIGQWIITFETPRGIQSQVIIPDSEYNASHVAAVIGHEVHRIETVDGLTQGPDTLPHRAV